MSENPYQSPQTETQTTKTVWHWRRRRRGPRFYDSRVMSVATWCVLTVLACVLIMRLWEVAAGFFFPA